MQMVFFSIPNTRPPIITSCEATEDEVILHLEEGVDRIAKSTLSTNYLIQTYGATNANTRYLMPFYSRPSASETFSKMKITALVLTILSVTLACFLPFPTGFFFASVAFFIATVVYSVSTLMDYDEENIILYENMRLGLINLRRIQNLGPQNFDTLLLEDAIYTTQLIADSFLNKTDTLYRVN